MDFDKEGWPTPKFGVDCCFANELCDGEVRVSVPRFGVDSRLDNASCEGGSVREARSGDGSVDSGKGDPPRSEWSTPPSPIAFSGILALEVEPSGERSPMLCRSMESKSGGRSILDDEAANAMASGPYGTPNLPNVSFEDRNLTWSDVGPVRG